MTHFATPGNGRSPAEAELASVLRDSTMPITGFVAFVVLLAGPAHHVAIALFDVLGFVADGPYSP